MSPPSSAAFEVRDIPNAGRGVIATELVVAGTLLHQSGPPAVHVIFKNYSKETCAYCFAWDRGRTLPVRKHELGKVFCSTECSAAWVHETGGVGIEAWRTLTAFVRAKKGGGGGGGGRSADADEAMAEGPPPSREQIGETWRVAAEKAEILRISRNAAPTSKKERKFLQTIQGKTIHCEDPDMLGYFLSGVLFEHVQPVEKRRELLSLAMDETPYKTKQDLEASCNAFLQLTSILSEELLPSLTPELCLNLVRADNHNAFGIRGGGEDSEEYMGYGVYPSASYFNHSCEPSLTKMRAGRSWEFRAAKDIQIGEECCITYLGGDEQGLNLAQRRSRLEDVWGFVCCCPKCRREAGV